MKIFLFIVAFLSSAVQAEAKMSLQELIIFSRGNWNITNKCWVTTEGPFEYIEVVPHWDDNNQDTAVFNWVSKREGDTSRLRVFGMSARALNKEIGGRVDGSSGKQYSTFQDGRYRTWDKACNPWGWPENCSKNWSGYYRLKARSKGTLELSKADLLGHDQKESICVLRRRK